MSFDPVASRRASIRPLKPYYRAPAEPLLRLDQNTNILGPNPAIARLALGELDLAQYPTRDADDLQAALAARHGLEPHAIACTNGSDEALDLVLKAYAEPGERFATADPSYSLYPFYAALHGLERVAVPLDDAWQTDIDAMIAARAKVTLVATPNNPTGRAVPREALERLVSKADGLVVIDEAYADYHDPAGLLALTREHRNLIVIRTFSKAHGLAGIRLGWLAAHPDTMEAILLVKPPFNIGLATERLGLLALHEQAFVAASTRTVLEERPRITKRLARRGFTVVPSDANFVLAFPPADGPPGPVLQARLRHAGIAARTFPAHPRLARAIRFTVGAAEHTDALMGALDHALAGGGP
jgi:histidinol-phosphate aminotransferase